MWKKVCIVNPVLSEIKQYKRDDKYKITSICETCHRDVYYTNGATKIQKHWKHYPKQSCGKKVVLESEEHKSAKRELTRYLNYGKSMYITHDNVKCHICDESYVIVIPNTIVRFEEEVSYDGGDGKCRFDIAGLDEKKNVVFGIEIFHTHRTNNIKARTNIPWIEIKAKEVLDKLDDILEKKEEELTLKCIRNKECMNNTCININNSIKEINEIKTLLEVNKEWFLYYEPPETYRDYEKYIPYTKCINEVKGYKYSYGNIIVSATYKQKENIKFYTKFTNSKELYLYLSGNKKLGELFIFKEVILDKYPQKLYFVLQQDTRKCDKNYDDHKYLVIDKMKSIIDDVFLLDLQIRNFSTEYIKYSFIENEDSIIWYISINNYRFSNKDKSEGIYERIVDNFMGREHLEYSDFFLGREHLEYEDFFLEYEEYIKCKREEYKNTDNNQDIIFISMESNQEICISNYQYKNHLNDFNNDYEHFINELISNVTRNDINIK